MRAERAVLTEAGSKLIIEKRAGARAGISLGRTIPRTFLTAAWRQRRGGAVEDYFLKIDGIPGESQDDKHKDWIPLASFSWGVTEPGAGRGAGSGAGRAKFSGFEFAMLVNKASPELFLSCVSGKHIKEAMLSVRQPAPQQLEY